MLVIAPEGWTVISNSTEIFTVDSKPTSEGKKDKELKRALSRFQINDAENSPIVQSFGNSDYVLHEFERSKAISTYLYCVVAGSFDALEPSPGKENPNVPMKLYCRKSLTKYAEKFKDDWFRVTNIGIKYYEKIF